MNETIIRTAVRNLYDLQKLRIQTGNRIVASFRDKIGIAPSTAEEEVPDAAAILDQLRGEYKLITDGVKRITKHFKPESKLLTNAGELRLMEAYDHQMRAEESHIKLIEGELDNHPIWTQWLADVRGVGPMMAGVIISEIDIRKCNSISALWKYAGLDTLTWFEIKERYSDDAPDKIYKRHPDGYRTRGPDVVTQSEWMDLLTMDGVPLGKYGLPPEGAEGFGEGRCRKKHHLVPKQYVNRDGEFVGTQGITFNPFLKTKLVGVLGAVFIKLGGPYREIYDEYKSYLESNPKHADKTKGHRHNMAIRYIVKSFLADLWTAWRTIEGLSVRDSYLKHKIVGQGKEAA